MHLDTRDASHQGGEFLDQYLAQVTTPAAINVNDGHDPVLQQLWA